MWSTSCGAAALVDPSIDPACRVRFQTYAEATESLWEARDVVDPGTGAVREAVLHADYVPDRITWSGFDSGYAGHLLALSEPRSSAEAIGTSVRVNWWDHNCSVQSCAEFAHEAFDDYSSFELRILDDLRAGDHRAVFEAAYGADGIARRPLYAASGETLPAFSPWWWWLTTIGVLLVVRWSGG